MTSNVSDANTNNSPSAYRSSTRALLHWVFVDKQGIRSGWSVLIFAAIFWSLNAVVMWALGRFVSLEDIGPIPFHLGLLQEACGLMVVAAATFVMARIEKKPLFSYGYIDQNKVMRFIAGIVWGFVFISVLVAIMWKAGWIAFGGKVLNGLTAWQYSVGWGFLFVLVGFFEESLLRGYAQYTLSRGIGFWWSALLLSIAFAFGHASNSGESALGIVEVCTAGLIFCLSLWYTKSLWWAVGFHAGWDWGQSYFYGTPDSGLLIQNHLLASHPLGKPLWSGGATGPEGSVLIVPLVILVGSGMWLWWGRKASDRDGFSDGSDATQTIVAEDSAT